MHAGLEHGIAEQSAKIGDRDTLRVWLLDLTEHLASRLRHAGLRARTVEQALTCSTPGVGSARSCSTRQSTPCGDSSGTPPFAGAAYWTEVRTAASEPPRHSRPRGRLDDGFDHD